MAVNLQQVAEMSGVSVSTASRALSGSLRVSASTREVVQRAARQLGYRPNATARSLRTRRSGLVGLVMPNLFNASFVAIAQTLQRVFEENGYQLVLSTSWGDEQTERRSVEALRDHQIDGVILTGSFPAGVAVLRESGIPTVHVAHEPADELGDCVLGANLEGARDAVTHLAQLGHRSVGIIGPPRSAIGDERLGGYRIALEQHGICFDPALVFCGPYAPETGCEGVDCLLDAEPHPTALFIAQHEAALGALPRLQSRGIKVPEQLSVICYEDSPMLRWWCPAVTAVDQNAQRVGELAADLLLARIWSRHEMGTEPHRFRVGARLISRESCAVPEPSSS